MYVYQALRCEVYLVGYFLFQFLYLFSFVIICIKDYVLQFPLQFYYLFLAFHERQEAYGAYQFLVSFVYFPVEQQVEIRFQVFFAYGV